MPPTLTPPPPPYLHPQYPHAAYLAGTTAPGSMRIDFRTPRIEAYAGGSSARLASAYCKVPKVCYETPTHFGVVVRSAQSVSGSRSTLWVVVKEWPMCVRFVDSLWVVLRSAQSVLRPSAHFRWFSEMPKVWWNTCHTFRYLSPHFG